MQPSHMLVYIRMCVHICLSDHNRPSKEQTLFFFLDFFLSSLMFPGVFIPYISIKTDFLLMLSFKCLSIIYSKIHGVRTP